ncbi:MAG: hypothetical protein KAT93_06740 [Desulfuromonadales bacterium]|nr:hypothetical protein [Desulfuromonadales bacterium]
MPSEFLVFLLYLFYGMAFFAIGVSITSRDTSASNLKIAGVLWLFALFAYSHAFHEWFELYRNLPSPEFPAPFIPLINFLKLGLVFVSFSFLLLFGVRVLHIVFPAKGRFINLLPFLAVALLLAATVPQWGELTPALSQAIDTRIRNFIGFPAAFTAGLGLIFYSRTLHHISSKGALNFTGAGLALITYGILTGIIPSGTRLPLLGAPIELLRGLSAFAMLHFVMHALHTFDEERKLLTEERLVRFAKSEKLHSLGKLAFGVAHEINNPLANVSLNIELLKKEHLISSNPERMEKRFQAIERNLERASNIAKELLVFATDRVTEFVPTDLNKLIDSTLNLLGARRKAYQIDLNYGSLPEVSAIPWKLEEVILNVIMNAMEATPEGGSITIATRQDASRALVEIIDMGSGIPADQIHRVLDPFYTTKEVGKGTGLGLSICFGIMEMHGGSIELHSQEGQGTTVTLSFPLEPDRFLEAASGVADNG